MNNASINGVCNEGKPSKVAIQDIMHSTITERNVTMIKRVHHGQRVACLVHQSIEIFWSFSKYSVYFVN